MKKITMYVTQTWPHCQTARVYLREQGIDFEEKDVGVDEAARNDFISKGLRAVPSFAIGDEIVVGFNRAEIEKLLDL